MLESKERQIRALGQALNIPLILIFAPTPQFLKRRQSSRVLIFTQ